MQTNNITKAFETELSLTEIGLTELAKEKSKVDLDVATDSGFKAAKKERAERNKLLSNIDRLAIDGKKAIDSVREDLKSNVSSIYNHIIQPMEVEEKKRKELAEKKKREEQERIAKIQLKIDHIKSMASHARNKPSDEIQILIEAVDMIDPTDGFDEFTKDALMAIKETLSELNMLLNQAIQQEQFAKQQEEFEKQKRELEEREKALQAKEEEPEPEPKIIKDNAPVSITQTYSEQAKDKYELSDFSYDQLAYYYAYKKGFEDAKRNCSVDPNSEAYRLATRWGVDNA